MTKNEELIYDANRAITNLLDSLSRLVNIDFLSPEEWKRVADPINEIIDMLATANKRWNDDNKE